MSFADSVISFNHSLRLDTPLPQGIRVMNPFTDPVVSKTAATFYRKYYDDELPRHLILGINPGRFGAGATGIPFTDPKRLIEKCDINFHGPLLHEPSSVFVYEVIDAFGGPTAFYRQFYINSVCPLGFTAAGSRGNEVNYNYYDSTELTAAVHDFIVENIKKQIAIGVETDVCFCFGTGKNEAFLRKLNQDKKYFRKIVALEHPRFIMQYKARSKQVYIDKYLEAFRHIS
jgi:hypothetical protein